MSATIDLRTDVTAGLSDRTTVMRAVEFACPFCGRDRVGMHVEHADGTSWVECDDCSYRCDPGVLEIPTEAVLATWHSQALRHSREALRCADGTPAGSYLAVVWCRRLAPELSGWGKRAFLDSVTRPIGGSFTDQQRAVLLDLGIALQMSAAAINDILESV